MAENTIKAIFKKITRKKLDKCNAYQLTVMAGILRDKLRDMDVRPAVEIETVRFRDKAAMLDYLAVQRPDEAPAMIPDKPKPVIVEKEVDLEL